MLSALALETFWAEAYLRLLDLGLGTDSDACTDHNNIAVEAFCLFDSYSGSLIQRKYGDESDSWP